MNKLESNNFCVPGSIDAEELTEIITTLYEVILIINDNDNIEYSDHMLLGGGQEQGGRGEAGSGDLQAV